MKTHVISLARTPERLEAFRANNHHVPDFEIFTAVDGRAHTRETLIASGLIDGSANYTSGAIGNALSHLALWETIRDTGAGTICEDDALLHSNFQEYATRALATLQDDWDIVYWGWNFDALISAEFIPGLSDGTLALNLPQMRQHAERYLKRDIQPALFRLYGLFGTMCYSLSPKGADKLIKFAVPIRETKLPFYNTDFIYANTSIDMMLNGCYPHINAFVCFPPLALSHNDHARSTVVGHKA